MSSNGSLFVSHCPLVGGPGSADDIGGAVLQAHWHSDPLGTIEAATEALRLHLSGHPHGDLVDHVVILGVNISQYVKQEGPQL